MTNFAPTSPHIKSPPAELQNAERAAWVALIAVCLISALAGRWCYLPRPFDNDAAIFIYMGKMVTEGGRLCHDLIDNKFPTVGLMTSILWRAFGTSWPAYIAMQTALSLTGAWLLGRIAARHAGTYAFWPTTLFAVVYLNMTKAVFGGFQLETAQIFFAILAARSAMIAIESDHAADAFVAGLCAGCGAMFKPTGLAVLGALTIALIAANRRRDRRFRTVAHLAAAGAGVAIPMAFAITYLAGADLLVDMPALWRQISTYASETAWATDDLIKPLVAGCLIGFPLLVRGWICRRQRDPAAAWPAGPIIIFAIAWLIAESAGVVMQRRMYAYHFLPIIPPAALLFGIIPRAARPGALAAAVLPMALFSIYTAIGVVGMSSDVSPAGTNHLAATDYLRAHARPGDAVWTDCWPRLMLETNLRPGSRYPFTFLFANYDTAGLDYADGMIADFERIKPAYIFLPEPLDQRVGYQLDFMAELTRRPLRRQNYSAGWHRIYNYTLAHYTREAMVGTEAAYRRDAEKVQLTDVK